MYKVVFIMVIFIAGSYSYEVPSPVFKLSGPDDIPIAITTSNDPVPNHLFSIFPSSLREVQVDYFSLHNWTGAQDSEFQQAIIHSEIITQVNTTELNFIPEIINSTNKQGIQFTASLPNGATVIYYYTMNLDQDVLLDIPHPSDEINCAYAFNFHPDCNCVSKHLMKRYSLEMAIDVYDWPFVELQDNFTFNALVLTLEVEGDFNLPYYFSINLSDAVNHKKECYVNFFDLYFTDIRIEASFFKQAFIDGKAKTVESVFDTSKIRPTSNGYVFPFQYVFEPFNESMKYDPDFSVLLGGGHTDDNGDTGSESSSDKTTMIILVCVLVPVAVIVVISLIAIIIVAWVIQCKRKPKREVQAIGF